MVCVAAFIILCVLSLSLPVIWIFNREVAASIWGMMKKAWGCVFLRLTFRKCDSKFKDEIKNKMLRRLVFRKPSWVKPMGIVIEVAGVLFVAIFVWSILEVVKGGLSLIAFGTCDVSTPENCIIGGTEACGVDRDLNWFTEWSEIFAVLPHRFRNWETKNYVPSWIDEGEEFDAINIFDPGCIVCRHSFEERVANRFFYEYRTLHLPYVILTREGEPMFHNSELIARYLVNLDEIDAFILLERIFEYQEDFVTRFSNAESEEKILGWLGEMGLDAEALRTRSRSENTAWRLRQIRFITEHEVRTRKIPTMIYDGRVRFGF